MKVYLVQGDDYNDMWVAGVFSSLIKATDYMDTHKDPDPNICMWVRELEVDSE